MAKEEKREDLPLWLARTKLVQEHHDKPLPSGSFSSAFNRDSLPAPTHSTLQTLVEAIAVSTPILLFEDAQELDDIRGDHFVLKRLVGTLKSMQDPRLNAVGDHLDSLITESESPPLWQVHAISWIDENAPDGQPPTTELVDQIICILEDKQPNIVRFNWANYFSKPLADHLFTKGATSYQVSRCGTPGLTAKEHFPWNLKDTEGVTLSSALLGLTKHLNSISFEDLDPCHLHAKSLHALILNDIFSQVDWLADGATSIVDELKKFCNLPLSRIHDGNTPSIRQMVVVLSALHLCRWGNFDAAHEVVAYWKKSRCMPEPFIEPVGRLVNLTIKAMSGEAFEGDDLNPDENHSGYLSEHIILVDFLLRHWPLDRIEESCELFESILQGLDDKIDDPELVGDDFDPTKQSESRRLSPILIAYIDILARTGDFEPIPNLVHHLITADRNPLGHKFLKDNKLIKDLYYSRYKPGTSLDQDVLVLPGSHTEGAVREAILSGVETLFDQVSIASEGSIIDESMVLKCSNKMNGEELERLTVAELKSVLRRNDMPVSGIKAVLIERIVESTPRTTHTFICGLNYESSNRYWRLFFAYYANYEGYELDYNIMLETCNKINTCAKLGRACLSTTNKNTIILDHWLTLPSTLDDVARASRHSCAALFLLSSEAADILRSGVFARDNSTNEGERDVSASVATKKYVDYHIEDLRQEIDERTFDQPIISNPEFIEHNR